MSYKVVSSTDLENLQEQASKLIDDGYMPTGGITYTRDTYMQPFYRVEEQQHRAIKKKRKTLTLGGGG